VVSAPARRELVRYMVDQGLSERRALHIARMSPSAYRYEPAPERNVHRCYGAGMIYLKLRQAGEIMSHK
jgi:hypothetical protein